MKPLGRPVGTGWQLDVMSGKDKRQNVLTGRKHCPLCHRLGDKTVPCWETATVGFYLILYLLPCSQTHAKATRLLKIHTSKHILLLGDVRKEVFDHPICYSFPKSLEAGEAFLLVQLLPEQGLKGTGPLQQIFFFK